VTTILKVDEDLQVEKNIMAFFTAVHGENSFEIRFLSDFGGGYANSLIRHGDYFYEMGKDGKQPYCKFSDEELNKITSDFYLHALAETHGACGVHFTANSPNFDAMKTCTSSDHHVVNGGVINCQFVDIDAPKEIRKDSVALKQFKYEQAVKIKAFSIIPSCVVETKHGYHSYWLLQNGNPELYRHIQMQLIQYFDGDASCINESHTLRMPFFYHMKDSKNKFPVEIQIWNPTFRYEQSMLKDSLPMLDEVTLGKVIRSNKLPTHDGMSQDRKSKVLDLVRAKVEANVRVETEILIRMHCCMGTHPDKSPSAWIDIEHMWYHCSGCGASSPLDILAEQLNWKDVFKAFNHYDMDIDGALTEIKQTSLSVSMLPQLQLGDYDSYVVNEIYNEVLQSFTSWNQEPNERHRQYIMDTIQILLKAVPNDKPYLMSLDMGAGKSTIIRIFIQKILELKKDYGCVVVVERKEDAKNLRDLINVDFMGNNAYAMYGYEEHECERNKSDNHSLKHCAYMAYKMDCPFIKNCRYFQQSNIQKDYPVLIMTLKRLDQGFQDLEVYKYFNNGEENIPRQLLIIDEKPIAASTMEMDLNRFGKYVDNVKTYLMNTDDQASLQEFEFATAHLNRVFSNAKHRELFELISTTFQFSKQFAKLFFSRYKYRQEIYEFPNFLESVLNNGGHTYRNNLKHRQEKKTYVVTSTYKNYANTSDFATVIFDGTSDIDPEYIHQDYNMINFEPLRTYENLEIYQCDYVSGSKTSLKKKVKSLCEQAIEILEENPTSKMFFPMFMDIEKEVTKNLKEYINDDKVIVAHYGETKGSNKFQDCDIVFLGGILHKREEHYIAKAKAIYGQCSVNLTDIKCSVFDKVRFNNPMIEEIKLLDMLVDYSQEIKRTSQRDNTRDVKGKVYVFHKDKYFLATLGLKFPKCKIVQWSPSVLTDDIIDGKKNNVNQKAFKGLLDKYQQKGVTEITYKQIRDDLQLTRQALNKLMESQVINNLIAARSYKVEVLKGKGSPKKLVKC
jgi:hypothetical protein